MNECFLRGKRVILRPLCDADITQRYLGWLNDEEVCRYNSHAVMPNTEQRLREYVSWAQETKDAIVLAIIWVENGEHIGNIALLNLDWIGRSANFAILIGERNYWNRGVGADAGLSLVRYAFERLNLSRVYCGTAEDNLGMQRLAERLGMQLEGRRRKAAYKLGRYIDIFEYGVLRAEFEALEADRGGI